MAATDDPGQDKHAQASNTILAACFKPDLPRLFAQIFIQSPVHRTYTNNADQEFGRRYSYRAFTPYPSIPRAGDLRGGWGNLYGASPYLSAHQLSVRANPPRIAAPQSTLIPPELRTPKSPILYPTHTHPPPAPLPMTTLDASPYEIYLFNLYEYYKARR